MIGDKERVEAGLFGDSRAGADCGAARLRTHVANCDCELHREFLPALAAPGSRQDWQACEHPVKLLAINLEASRVGRPSAKQRKPYNLDAILDVAVRVFRERGYDGSSLEHVARAAGITQATIYSHLPHQEEYLAPRVARGRGP